MLENQNVKRKYSWKPDTPDQRDFLYAKRAKKLKVEIKSKVDLRPQMAPVYDQGAMGSCTAQALAGHLFFNKGINASRLFIYYNERLIEGTVKVDAGAMLRDGIKSLVTYGAANEKLWAYNIAKLFKQPPATVYADGLKNVIKSYHRVTTLDDMLQCLSEGYPFAIGISVYEYFESAQVAKTGKVPLPLKSEKLLGGHAILVVGYDKAKKTFICRNSWGDEWGMEGYFTLPFAYLDNANLAADGWTIR